MVMEYIIKGLKCANCAGKIENALKKEEEITSVSLNFINSKLKVEVSHSDEEKVLNLIKETVNKYEATALVAVCNASADKGVSNPENNLYPRLARLIGGGLILAFAIISVDFLNVNFYIGIFLFIASYLILGGEIVFKAARNISRGKVFDENLLMTIATLGAFATENYSEAVAVMLFFQIGEFFQEKAVDKSKKSISDLMDIRPDYANLIKNGEIIKVSPENVSIGEIIVVKPGEKIPLDGRIIVGNSTLDTSALTGESTPRRAFVSEDVLSGCINLSGVLTIEVTKQYSESTVAKIIDLVENAGDKKAKTENFITTFSKYYTPFVVGLGALLATLPPLFFGGDWSEWINRALIFLVISCPCALVVSIPLGFFAGIGKASRNGILIKGGNYLEALNTLEIVVFDKTGTLTEGVFQVTKVIPGNGFKENDVLEIAAKGEVFSNHPIALSILQAYGKIVDKKQILEYKELSGYGISVISNGKQILLGNDKLMIEKNIQYIESKVVGTKIYVAEDNKFVGVIIISDKIKEDSIETINNLKKKNVQRIVMLTGDNEEVANVVGQKLNIDELYSELLPHQKVEKLELLSSEKSAKGKLVFIGDGINDAPVLALADIGIAMGGLGSDAAIEAADVIFMTDEPRKLIEAIDIAKYTKKVIYQNIVFALGVKGLFLILGAVGLSGMWGAVFADVGVSVLAVLNSMRILRNRETKK